MVSAASVGASLGLLLLLIAAAHSLVVLGAAGRWWLAGRRASPMSGPHPPVSILKPLCGAEEGLYENLRSFCEQEYAEYEIIFGVQSVEDPALKLVGRLIVEFPRIPITAVIDARCHGANRKVSNLQNMIERARHDVWVIADSDALVCPLYLSTVTGPLRDPTVGVVSCTYHDQPEKNFWSRLAALYVNDWFIPSVRLAWALGQRDYVSGQTICVRRDTIESIGGMTALGDHLADDYQLGELVRGTGRSIVLSHYVPRARHYEPTLASLIEHEVRWMRTVAVLKPGSFRLLFLTFSLPLALVGLLLVTTNPPLWNAARWVAVGVAVLRLCIHWTARRGAGREIMRDVWLLPFRDLLIAYVWTRALRASRVVWRGVEFKVEDDGILRSIAERTI